MKGTVSFSIKDEIVSGAVERTAMWDPRDSQKGWHTYKQRRMIPGK